MARIGFGAFLAPHHPIGEHPMLQFRRDLDFAEHLDKLGYDEFWCGEHHSTGWEIIASPEMFLAAAGERTQRIKLGTGVVSLPYHHPFNVAQRIVQLDHMTRRPRDLRLGSGRAVVGCVHARHRPDGAARPPGRSDRRHQAADGRRARHATERLVHAARRALQLLPLQEDMPFVTASQISPSGHDARRQTRHRRDVDRLDVDRRSQALPLQWSFAEEAAEDTARPSIRGLARADELAHRRDARTGARAKQARACCAGTTNTPSAR